MSDKRLELKVNGSSITVWGDVDETGATHWMIDQEGSIIAELTTRTERLKRIDFSGEKEYKIIHKTHCEITYRVAYKKAVTLSDDYFQYAGEKTAVKEIVKTITADNWPIIVEMELEMQCRKAGISDQAIFFARYNDNCYRASSSPNQASINLCNLLEN